MDQIWKDEKVIPVTVIKAEPNRVTLTRTKEKDHYSAVQLQNGKEKREFRVEDESILKAGDSVDVSAFNEGDLVEITGTSKGRGFQGVIKRHNFGGGPKTHGQKNRFRAPGSIGSTAFQRVVPGRKMAGHMGVETVSIKNLKVAKVDKENNLLMLKGAVPGSRGSLIMIKRIRSSSNSKESK